MVVWNYTSVVRRQKRIYSFFDFNLSRDGISLDVVITAGLLIVLFTIPGLIVCKVTDTIWYNPIMLAKSTFCGYFWLIFIGAPIGLGVFLHTFKIQNYVLIDYLKIYFRPRHALNKFGKRLTMHSYKINSFVEKI